MKNIYLHIYTNNLYYLRGVFMSTKITEIMNNVLALSEKERAIVAERVISSLDSEYDKDSEIEWQKEIQKRITQIDEEKVSCLPWEVALKQIGST